MTYDEMFSAARRQFGDPLDPKLSVALCADSREQVPFQVASRSIAKTSPKALVRAVDLRSLITRGLYTRPTDRRDGRLWDVNSDAPMATEHAIARFFVPALYDFRGWVLSADCDILVRSDLAELFALADDRYAAMVVKHQQPDTGDVKMDGQIQTAYARKNWSSVILWNCAHPAHLVLRPEPFGILNRWPGRDLHAFKWLQDEEIGELSVEWNYLVGVTDVIWQLRERSEYQIPAKLAHFTLGTPDMPGYEDCELADEWRAYASTPVAVSA
jgi:hypothetical protein